MPRVMVIGSYSPSLVRFRGDLIRALVRQGHSVRACAPEIESWVAEWLKESGAEFESIPIRRTGTNPIEDLRTIRSLRKAIRRWRPSHLLTYTVKPVVYGAIAARLEGVPHFFPLITGLGSVFLDGAGEKRAINLMVRMLYRHAMNQADRVLFQNKDDISDFISMRLLRDDEKCSLTRGSGVNLEEFTLEPLPERPAFLMIARLIRDKGVFEFIEAAKMVRGRRPDAVFRLAGWVDTNPGSVGHEALESWIEEGVVEYLGKLNDVRPALRDCLIYVLPSYREGTPRTVLEAMATGRPVITTDVPGCRETVVVGKNGYLVPPRDPRALADAMLQMIQSRPRMETMGEASRRMAEERFDVHSVNAEIIRTMGL